MVAQVEEVGTAIRPAEASLDPSASGVALQAPTALASTSNGVPNAARLLASGERRSDTKPTPGARQVVAEARAAINAMTSYEVAMHRQERAGGTLQPEEDVVLAVRREPRAVRLSWPSGTNQGREVLYRADEPGGQMHIKMANPALPRLNLAPDSPMVMRNSRHPITEAGFDSLVEGLENALNAPEAYRTDLLRPRNARAVSISLISSLLGRPLLERAGRSTSIRKLTSPRSSRRSTRRENCSNATCSRASGRTRPNSLPPTPSTRPHAGAHPKGLFGRIAQGKTADSTASPR